MLNLISCYLCIYFVIYINFFSLTKCLCGCGQDVWGTKPLYIFGHEPNHSFGFYTSKGIKSLYEMGLLTLFEIKHFKGKGII